MSEKAVPTPTPESQPYWDAAARHELCLPRCLNCGCLHFYPRAYCPHCSSADLAWERVSGRGTLESFVINHTPAPGYEDEGPYSIALVMLADGVRLMCNIVDVEQTPEALRIGMPVEVTFEERGSITIPQFRPERVTA
jgi:hypothetical protein